MRHFHASDTEIFLHFDPLPVCASVVLAGSGVAGGYPNFIQLDSKFFGRFHLGES